MPELDEILRAELHARAQDVSTGPAPDVIRTSAHRFARRRWMATAGSAVAVVAVVAAGAGVATVAGRAGGQQQPGSGPGPSTEPTLAQNLVAFDGRSIPYTPRWLPPGSTEKIRAAQTTAVSRNFGSVDTSLEPVRPDYIPGDAERVPVGDRLGYGWALPTNMYRNSYRVRWLWRDGVWGGVTVWKRADAKSVALRVAASFAPIRPIQVELPFSVGAPVSGRMISVERRPGGAVVWGISADVPGATVVVTNDPLARGVPARPSSVVTHLSGGLTLGVASTAEKGHELPRAALLRLAASVRITGPPDLAWFGTVLVK
jgi:hypothetical protein